MTGDEISKAIDQTRAWIQDGESRGRVVHSSDIDLYIQNTWKLASQQEVIYVYNHAVYYRRAQ